MDKNTAKLLRFIYKNNNIKKIQKKFREFLNSNKKNNITKSNNKDNSNQPSNVNSTCVNKNEYLSIIKEENNTVFNEENYDIKFKNANKNSTTNKNNKQSDIKIETNTSENSKTINNLNIKEHIYDKNTNMMVEEKNDIKEDNVNNAKNNIDKIMKIKENPKPILKKKDDEKKNYYFNYKKPVDSTNNQYRQKNSNIEEKEKVFSSGKYDMISYGSLKTDSVGGGEKNQSTFYFSNKGKENYRQTVNSIKEIDKNESGINRVNKGLFFCSPIEDSNFYSFYITIILFQFLLFTFYFTFSIFCF